MTSFSLPFPARPLDVDVAAPLEEAVPDGWRPFVRSEGAAPLVRVQPRAGGVPEGPLGFDAGEGRFRTRNFEVTPSPSGPVATVVPAAAVIAQAVRVAIEGALARAGWWTLHASAVLVEGRAVVCSARSGTGKSTLARHCDAAGLPRFSDEATALSLRDGRVVAAAHPSQLVSARLGEVFPVASLCFLERGEPGFTALPAAEAVRALLGGLFVHDDRASAAGEALSFATAVAAAVPVVRLSVPDAPEAASWVRRVAAGGTAS